MSINKSIKRIVALAFVSAAIVSAGCSKGYSHLKADQLNGDVVETTTNGYVAEFKFGEWVEKNHNERIVNKYDKNGNFVLREEFSVNRKGAVKLRKLVKYDLVDAYNFTAEEYDGDGELVVKSTRKKEGDVVTLTNYNKDGAINNVWSNQVSDVGASIKGEVSVYVDGKVAKKGAITYKNDDKGRMLEETIAISDVSGGEEEKYVTKRTFTESGFVASTETGDIKIAFEYLDVDDKGNWTKRLRTLSIEDIDTKFIEKRDLVYKK